MNLNVVCGVKLCVLSQFYSWYYHTLPFLLWQTDLPVVLRLVVLAAVEFSFNVFPASPTSSAVLQVKKRCRAASL